MIIRGSTPTLRINVKSDVDLSLMKDIWVTLRNNVNEVTYKLSESSIVIETTEDKNLLIIKMSQTETLTFTTGPVKIQVRFLDNNNDAFASQILNLSIGDVLKEGVMS